MSYKTASRLNMVAMLIISCFLLSGYYLQIVLHEPPCPLCLLQRVAMCFLLFGLLLNLRCGIRPSHYGIIALGALFGAAVSIRQILLHIIPGTPAFGAPILGLHAYTWALIAFATSLIIVSLMLLSDKQFKHPDQNLLQTSIAARFVCWLAIALIAANVLTTFAECGIWQCPDNPVSYWLISSA